MADKRTEDPPEPPIEQNGVKDSNVQNTIYNRYIEHATTATVVNNRSTNKSTFKNRPEKQNSSINSSKVYRNIFEAIKHMDDTTAIVTLNNIRITNIK